MGASSGLRRTSKHMSSQNADSLRFSADPPTYRVAVIVLNYRTPELALQAAASAGRDVDPLRDVVLIVDNMSPDGSADRIEQALPDLGMDHVRLVRSPTNGGFAAGNNVGIRAVSAEAYMLLNSDTIVGAGTVEELHAVLESDATIGIASPQLCWEDGTPQISCFRFLGLGSEFIRGAATGAITRLLRPFDVPLGVLTTRTEVPWTSFACVMIARRVLETCGLLDEGYFMYFEDADYCRTVRAHGFRVVHEPRGKVVHLRGKSSPVKEATRLKKARPSYYYEARSRYFLRGYGFLGAFLANLFWSLGLLLVLPRQLIGQKERTLMEDEFTDNWRGKRPSKELSA